MFGIWALYNLILLPVQLVLGIAKSSWKISGGGEIPYLQFPTVTLAILILSALARLSMVAMVYRSLRSVFSPISSRKVLSRANAKALRRVGYLLLVFSALDILTYPTAYLSLTILEPRVPFELGIFGLLALVTPPEKLVLAGFALASAQVLEKGAELNEDAELTI
ncbi:MULTISPECIES: DUF2975 domain-containing protein [Paraburkholderia]|uniref:DUF2975 domain-containing protein n=1 Tax=Paraburkholderia TaxID=1822464 RepID=UPI003218DD16